MQSKALLIFDNDIKSRSWLDWLSSHTSFSKPLSRYEGVITLQNDGLYFTGFDKRGQQEADIVIYKQHITGLFHGYDKNYNLGEVRGLGFTWQPIRITFNETGEEQDLYLIVNYNLGQSDNNEWLTWLKKWLG